VKFLRGLRAKWRRLGFLDQITAISHIVVTIAGLAGILFFLLERWDTEDQSRRETALQFIALSYTDDTRKAKHDSNVYILSNIGQFSQARQKRTVGLPSDFRLPSDAVQVFLQRLEFYDHVLICRALGQCDRKLIDDIFREDMCNFNGWLQVVLPQLEADFGPGIADRLRIYCTGALLNG
jgi:hypothetical protein